MPALWQTLFWPKRDWNYRLPPSRRQQTGQKFKISATAANGEALPQGNSGLAHWT